MIGSLLWSLYLQLLYNVVQGLLCILLVCSRLCGYVVCLRFIIEPSQPFRGLHRRYGLFSFLGKCLPHVFNLSFRQDSARLLGILTQPACLTCHPLTLLTTHLETGDSGLPAYATALRLMATVSCPSWLHVLCSIDSVTCSFHGSLYPIYFAF